MHLIKKYVNSYMKNNKKINTNWNVASREKIIKNKLEEKHIINGTWQSTNPDLIDV